MNLEITENPDQGIQHEGYYTPYNVDLYKIEDEIRLGNYISRASKLPDKLKSIFFDFSTAEFIEEKLGTQFGLLGDQKLEITRVVRDVILADIYIGDMPAEISSKLGVNQNTALEIARAIVSQLFAPVIEEIKKLQLQKFGKLPGSSAPQSPRTRQNFVPQNLGGQTRPPQHIIGEELPETGGNIIDLRKIDQ